SPPSEGEEQNLERRDRMVLARVEGRQPQLIPQAAPRTRSNRLGKGRHQQENQLKPNQHNPRESEVGQAGGGEPVAVEPLEQRCHLPTASPKLGGRPSLQG